MPPLPNDPGFLASRRRGFALLSPERRAEISGKGGRRAHELGTAHTFTSEEAKIAGTKGALVSAARRRKRAR